ncbi:MAG: hypothetical protein H0V44_06500 [Planctomycetes bacterium]|nr:hypothetical protein [Planctomycetota bacterium]
MGRVTLILAAFAAVAGAAAVALYLIGGSWQSNTYAYGCAFSSVAAFIASFLCGFVWVIMALVRKHTEKRFGTQVFRKPRT